MKIKEKTAALFLMFSEDPLHFFGSAVIVAVVSLLSLGVFAIPVYAGYARMFEAVILGGRPDFKQVLSSMNRVVSMFVLLLIMASTVALGAILIIPGLMAAALWLYAPFFMEFHGLGVEESLKKSAKLAIEKNYMHHLMLAAALAALNSLGLYLVIGWIITIPFTVGFLFLLFRENAKKPEINSHEGSASLT